MFLTKFPPILLLIASVTFLVAANSLPASSPRELARRNAELASPAFGEMHRWLHEVALPKIDPQTNLFRATGDSWNYRDTAADCYPFLAWAAYFTDKEAFEGPVLEVLRAEVKLCSHHGPIPVNYDLRSSAKEINQPYDSVVFGASEYMKDGLVAVVEAAGPGEWLDRMRAIADELWRRANIETPYGKLVSSNLEVNGDLMQVLVRLFGLTGDQQYLECARRIADYYLNDPAFVPRHLDDHGCELIGGLGLLQGVESTVAPEREKRYRPLIKKMLDTILERGLNSDGLMLDTLADTPGPHDDKPLTDNWGYNYVSFYCYYLVTGDSKYRDAIQVPLKNLVKPKYHLYPWEGTNIDGFADSIEGALYLLSVLPVEEGIKWADREVAETLIGKPISGTSKFECNAIRTVILYALSKTQGIHVPEWRDDLRLGAARDGEGVVVFIGARSTWEGELLFDVPRHNVWFSFKHDWPRINYLPEYFTVSPEGTYSIEIAPGTPRAATGKQLREGLPVRLSAGEELFITVKPATTQATQPEPSRETKRDEQSRGRRPDLPPDIEQIEDIVYGTGGSRELHLDVIRPKTEPPSPIPVVVWVHGGGWLGGSRKGGPALFLASHGYFVAGIEYRLSHEAKFPAQIEDCKCAVRYLRAHARRYNIDPQRIGAWGPSAGGHLVALLGTSGGIEELEGNGGWQEQVSRVQAVCDWFGPTDFTKMGGSHDDVNSPECQLVGGSLADKADVVRAANPITYITPDDPPFLIMHGEDDTTVPVNQSELLYDALKKAGVEATFVRVKNAGHGFGQRPGGRATEPSREEIHRQVVEFFDKHLKARP